MDPDRALDAALVHGACAIVRVADRAGTDQVIPRINRNTVPEGLEGLGGSAVVFERSQVELLIGDHRCAATAAVGIEISAFVMKVGRVYIDIWIVRQG